MLNKASHYIKVLLKLRKENKMMKKRVKLCLDLIWLLLSDFSIDTNIKSIVDKLMAYDERIRLCELSALKVQCDNEEELETLRGYIKTVTLKVDDLSRQISN